MANIIEVSKLSKRYGDLVAVDDVSFSVASGEVFGLLGHNGAGKTTTIECVLGTRERDSGICRIFGLDPALHRREVFEKVGVQFQQSGFQDRIRVAEICEVTAALYRNPASSSGLLERFGLEAKARTPVSELSGGERQKLALVLALIPDPEVLFLDELTTGLDPQARHRVWNLIEEIRSRGVTIFLTSHYMDEVERLCTRIAILRSGRLAAKGSPDELVREHGTRNLEEAFLKYMEKEDNT